MVRQGDEKERLQAGQGEEGVRRSGPSRCRGRRPAIGFVVLVVRDVVRRARAARSAKAVVLAMAWVKGRGSSFTVWT